MHEIISDKLFFRTLTEKDVTEEYVSWLNSQQINQFLEVRHTVHTLASVSDFVSLKNDLDNEYLFGIFCKNKNKHIGNVKIGNINHIYFTGDLSLFIGDKNYLGRRLASEIIGSLTDYGFNYLGLKKMCAGCYETNIKSMKSFLRCGYEIEGVLKNQVIFNGKRENIIKLGISSGV